MLHCAIFAILRNIYVVVGVYSFCFQLFFFSSFCWFFVLWIAIPTIDRIFVQNPKIFWRRRQAIVIAKCVRLSKKYCHFCEKTIAFPKERQTTLNSSTHKISTNNYTIYNIGTSIGECVNVVPVQLNNGMLENRLGPFFSLFLSLIDFQ